MPPPAIVLMNTDQQTPSPSGRGLGARLNAWAPLPLATTLVALLAVVGASAAGVDTAHAQQVDDSLPPLADLTIASEYGTSLNLRPVWAVTVKNETVGAHPGMHVHLANVQVTISDPVRGDTTSIWTIRDLPPGGSVTAGIRSLQTIPAATSGPEVVPQRFYAEIIEADPVESPRFRFNNATEHWAIENRREVNNKAGVNRYTNGDIAIDVPGISDRSPQPGATTTFTVAARIDSKRIADIADVFRDDRQFDVQVEISLSPGLSFAANQPDAPSGLEVPDGTTFATTTGIWNIGTLLQSNTSTLLQVAVNLTADSLADLPLEERCLTAKVVSAVPWFANDPLKRQNDTATACLGKELLTQGETALFDYVDCVGATSTPCTSADTVQLVVERETGYYYQPETVIVQIQEPQGRHDGKWRTGKTTHHNASVPDTPGVEATFSFLSRDYSAYTFALSDVSPKQRPGAFSILGGNAGTFVLLDADTKTSLGPLNLPANTTNNPYPSLLEFSALGTYKVQLTVGATKSGTAHNDTETYTFHVGPIADLEVSDGDASPHVDSDSHALTIVAVNNGPDHSLGARVTGLPTGAEVVHVSQGSYDGTAGVWNTGELKHKDYLRGTGRPDATLVLDTNARDTADVTIENSVAYTVCIGSDGNDLAHTTETDCEAVTGASWHTTPVYDYNNNNTATINASRGTGGVGPDVPGNARTLTGITAVTWEPVEYLYGLPVERYEVQWLGNDWTTLDRAATDNQFVDAAPSGRRDYRVRAVNTAGVAGPWSRSSAEVQAGHAGPPLNLRTRADGNNAIDVSWDAPDDVGGSAVTGYTVQWSSDGSEGSWRNAGSTADQTFKHRGLQTGAVRWYRVAAQNRSGLGLWSDPVQGQSAPGAPDAPTLTAKTLSDYQIELTWNEPKDNGEPITGYEIEYSADGSADSWDRLVEVGADPTDYTDDSLPANTRRHYRVRAVNSVGGGAWSRSVSAITQLTPPDAPSLTSVEADGPNAIVVTWEEPWYLGDLSITQYQVQWAKDQYSEIWRGPQTLSGSTLSWRHTGLKPDETWYYQVRASNGGGRWSVWSYIWAATTASDNAPKAVSGLSAQFDKDSYQVNLTWNDLSGDGQTISYELEWSEDGSDWRDLTTVSSCDAGKCAYADTDIWPGAKLYYRVRASIDGDAGPWSSAKSVSVPPDPPDEPRIIWVESDGSNHIYLEWEPQYYDGGAAITGYGLLWCRALDGADEDPCEVTPDENSPLADPPGYSRISLGASQLSYTHSVSPGYYYYYLLGATNGGNRWSEWQEYDITYGRTYAGVPAAPGLTARAVDSGQIKLTWTKPNDYGSEITTYWLYVYQEGDNLYDWDNILDIHSIPGDRAEWTIDDLSPETTRYFRIRALNDNGEGKYSALRQATTPDS